MKRNSINIEAKDFNQLKELILDIPARYSMKPLVAIQLIETKIALNNQVKQKKKDFIKSIKEYKEAPKLPLPEITGTMKMESNSTTLTDTSKINKEDI